MAPLVLAAVVVACGGDDDGDEPAPSAEPTATAAATPAAVATPAATPAGAEEDTSTASSVGTVTLGDEQLELERMLCYFEEQPRAGLGGTFTHTAQGRATNAAGEPVVLDLSRARAEDGSVEDLVIVDIGDPLGDDALSLTARGGEGLIDFADARVSGSGIEVSEFGGEARTLSFEAGCG